MLNNVLLIGRLVQEPRLRLSLSGIGIAEFTVAYNRRYRAKNGEWKEESHFFDCRAIGRIASLVVERLSKGDLVLIEGRLIQDRWEKDGQKQSRVRIFVEGIRRIELPKRAEEPPVEEKLPEEEIEEEISLD